NSVQVITLNGWLRIVPPFICKQWKGRLFNGHPGLITKFPELRGKDPQQKAFELQMKKVGSVVHEVTEKVDDGKVITESEIDLIDTKLEDYFSNLRRTSIHAWEKFFKLKLLC